MVNNTNVDFVLWIFTQNIELNSSHLLLFKYKWELYFWCNWTNVSTFYKAILTFIGTD